MKYVLTVVRQERGTSDKYRQSFACEMNGGNDTVASALTEINNRTDLRDISGGTARPVEWECSCLQKKCGACAMLINGRPMLACDARVAEIGTEEITVAPLSKFPCICDLVVDRTILQSNLKTIGAWLREDASLPDKYRDLAYEGSECIQCGCCLEVCPNFYAGGSFFGMASVPITTRLLTETEKAVRKDIAKEYSRHFYAGCGKSLACRDICPRHIDTERLLVNSNAMAIWKRR